MITWMQRHKKWLVITIWISAIAFVGAGFVGWGSYDYGSKGGTVALVGDRKVSVNEYQREYSQLFEQYSQVFGQEFNQETADKLRLKEAAYNLVIQKNLILSYADELGLDVTDEEIVKQLVKIPAFIKDGKFDKDTYIKVLNQNRTNPIEFEAQLKRDLLLQKVEQIFNLSAQNNEIKSLNRLLFSEDDISIKILTNNDITINITEDEVKKYWETSKENYRSQPAIKLEYDEVPLSSQTFSDEEINEYYTNFKTDFKKEDGKIKSLEEAKEDVIRALNVKLTKKTALKKFLSLKKGEEEFENKDTVFESKLAYDENNKAIKDAIPGDILKPFLHKDKYVILKVVNKVPSKALSFEKAKDLAKIDYIKAVKSIELNNLASKQLESFVGESIGYVSRNSFDKIKGLNSQEALTFLNQLFSLSEKKGKISVGEKIVLYKINDTRLASYDPAKDETVRATINNLINQELMNNFVKNLQNRYEVQSEIKFEE